MGTECKGEWLTTRHKCWATFPLRRRFWRRKGFGVEQMRMLRMGLYRLYVRIRRFCRFGVCFVFVVARFSEA